MTPLGRRALDTGHRVRPARLDDADTLGRVHVAAWREAYTGRVAQAKLAALDPAARGERWRTILTSDGPGRTLVGLDPAGEVVGFVSAGPCRDDDAPAERELWAIYLLARAHGSGLADAMLDAAIGSAAASLWVLADNPRAHAFYARHGFAPDGARLHDDDLAADEVRLVRGPVAGRPPRTTASQVRTGCATASGSGTAHRGSRGRPR